MALAVVCIVVFAWVLLSVPLALAAGRVLRRAELLDASRRLEAASRDGARVGRPLASAG